MPESLTLEPNTAVIITAKDAEAFCAKAVASALAQRLAREVIFVDDGSSDATLATALSADDGTGRLRTIRFEQNRGPAAGRNAAIDVAASPYICILDADDFLSDGRLERMFERGGEGWDLLADDLTFASGPHESLAFETMLPEGAPLPWDLSLTDFALGNLPLKGRYRREMGFLKPVIRRAFVVEHGIRYDERLRLGEDLLYYAACLVEGAVFRVIEACGYHAIQHPNSLSAQHRTRDIALLHTALGEFETRHRAEGRDVGQLPAYTAAVRRNLALRTALDAKREGGWRGFIGSLRQDPDNAGFVFGKLVMDKLFAPVGR